ncbi:MAG: hypothetical protein ACKVOX_05700 [Rhizobacter sp.]
MTDITRADGGRFVAGQAPKSPGRPIGPSRAEQIAAYLEPHKQAVLDKAIELAKLGDPQSMKLVLERLAPIPKQDSERVSIPGFSDAGTLQAKAEAVLAAAASGHCSAEAAQKLLSVLDMYARAITATDHEKRLQAIESGRAGPVVGEIEDPI